MTKTERKQNLELFHGFANLCRANDDRLSIDADIQSAVVVADELIAELQRGGKRGGSATTEAKARSSAANGRKGGRPRKATG